MSNVEKTSNRSSFFPSSKEALVKNAKSVRAPILERNDPERKNELDKISKEDTKIDIKESIKNFSKIKRAVEKSAPIDNSKKISDLKNRIENGTYEIDFEALADRMLNMEYLRYG